MTQHAERGYVIRDARVDWGITPDARTAHA